MRVRARVVCVVWCVHSPCCDQEPTNHDTLIERFSLTVSDLESAQYATCTWQGNNNTTGDGVVV